MLTFQKLRIANLSRCEKWHGSAGVHDWNLSEWGVAMGGECGEALDAIKKINRVDSNILGNKKSREELMNDLANELADIIIYADLLAARAGIDLDTAIISKFNEVSNRFNFPELLEE